MYKSVHNYLCIAISGLSGCGNTSVSKQLAQALELTHINYTFRNLAKEENIDFNTLRIQAETDDKWDILVDNKQVALSRETSCIVGSRLAIWMISHAHLKVYLEASEQVRAGRICTREGGILDEIMAETRERDKRDAERYMQLYQIDTKDYQSKSDIVIDVNNISVDEVVDCIIKELILRKLIVS